MGAVGAAGLAPATIIRPLMPMKLMVLFTKFGQSPLTGGIVGSPVMPPPVPGGAPAPPGGVPPKLGGVPPPPGGGAPPPPGGVPPPPGSGTPPPPEIEPPVPGIFTGGAPAPAG